MTTTITNPFYNILNSFLPPFLFFDICIFDLYCYNNSMFSVMFNIVDDIRTFFPRVFDNFYYIYCSAAFYIKVALAIISITFLFPIKLYMNLIKKNLCFINF